MRGCLKTEKERTIQLCGTGEGGRGRERGGGGGGKRGRERGRRVGREREGGEEGGDGWREGWMERRVVYPSGFMHSCVQSIVTLH